jgi:hypothetical protein
VGLTLVWIALACLPLPRPLLAGFGRPVFASDGEHQPGRSPGAVADDAGRPAAPPAAPLPDGASNAPPAAAASAKSTEIGPEVTRPRPPARELVLRRSSVRWSAAGGASPPRSTAAALPTPPPAAAPEGRAHAPARARPATSPGLGSWLARAFLAGMAVCCAWLLAGRLALVRLGWGSVRPPAWLAELYAALPLGQGCRRPALLLSTRCDRPLAYGLVRPTILLPADGCRPACRGPLRHVLLHELGHARQRDAWGQALFNLAFPLLFFHPLYWWLRGRARLCRELVADDWAARQSDREAYARELIQLIVSRGRCRGAGLSMLGVFHSPTEFYRRMTMLLEREQALETRCTWAWRTLALAAGALAMVLFAGSFGLRADDSAEDEAAAEERLDDEADDGEEDGAGEDGEEDEGDDEESDEEEAGEEEDADEGQEDAEDESDDEEGDDEDESGSEETDEEEGTDEESLLGELESRREALAAELAELEARIQESTSHRAWRESEARRLAARSFRRTGRPCWRNPRPGWRNSTSRG